MSEGAASGIELRRLGSKCQEYRAETGPIATIYQEFCRGEATIKANELASLNAD
jgi:hypothetical protein